MSGISGRLEGGASAKMFFSAAKITDKTETNLETVTSNTAFEIIDIAEIGAISKTRTIVDVPVYGEDFSSKLVGQAAGDDFTFNVTYRNENTIHGALKDDDGKTEHTFVVQLKDGANNTSYVAFDGYISASSLNVAFNDRVSLDVTVARTGADVRVDAS